LLAELQVTAAQPAIEPQATHTVLLPAEQAPAAYCPLAQPEQT
jgi:hypothetical protein